MCVCVSEGEREREYMSEKEGDAHLQAKWRSLFLNSLHYYLVTDLCLSFYPHWLPWVLRCSLCVFFTDSN